MKALIMIHSSTWHSQVAATASPEPGQRAQSEAIMYDDHEGYFS